MHFERMLDSDILYEGKILTLKKDRVELEDGTISAREVVVHNGGVAVAALDDEDNMLFVRQFRYPYGEEVLEIPAGKRELSEPPLECGKRELEEETGFCARHFEELAVLYPTPGYCSEIIHVFYAKDLFPAHQHLDEGEFLSVEKIPFSEALQMVMDGKIPDAKTQLAILKLYALRMAGK